MECRTSKMEEEMRTPARGATLRGLDVDLMPRRDVLERDAMDRPSQQMDDVGQRKGHCEPTAGEDLASTNEASTSRTVCSVDYDPGVSLEIAVRPGGRPELLGVRFHPRMYSEATKSRWWQANKQDVYDYVRELPTLDPSAEFEPQENLVPDDMQRRLDEAAARANTRYESSRWKKFMKGFWSEENFDPNYVL